MIKIRIKYLLAVLYEYCEYLKTQSSFGVSPYLKNTINRLKECISEEDELNIDLFPLLEDAIEEVNASKSFDPLEARVVADIVRDTQNQLKNF